MSARAVNRLRSQSKIAAQEKPGQGERGAVLDTPLRRACDLAQRDESQGGQQGVPRDDTKCSPEPPTCEKVATSKILKNYNVVSAVT